MTEGRGPMVLVKIIRDREKAIAFALTQPGVMGIRGRQQYVADKPLHLTYYDVGGTILVDGDWQVVETEVE